MFFILFFFFNDTATTEIYTLSLHDALPIFHAEALGRHALGRRRRLVARGQRQPPDRLRVRDRRARPRAGHHLRRADQERSEEHTSELQSPCNLVCRLLLEKKKKHKCTY